MLPKTYLRLIYDGLKTALAFHGFVKRGATFLREGEESLIMFNVQKSTKSNREKAFVTVNCGVFLIALGRNFDRTANIWSCHWRQRIGYLAHEKHDKWWEITSETTAKHTAMDIQRLVVEFGLPELLKRDTNSKLLQCWKAGEYGGLTEGQRRRYVQAVEGGAE